MKLSRLGLPILCPVDHAGCPLPEEVLRLQQELQQLSQLIEVDPLTGLFNFRRLQSALEQELERTRRTGLRTSLIMIDLDHFKRVNDTYGHQAGNKALCHASSIWRERSRRVDLVCRYGGEEFAIILPTTPLVGAVRAAERLRQALATSPVELEGRPVTLTASLGVDSCCAEDCSSAHEFLARTDRYLLQAKAEGRNRVCHPPLAAPSSSEVSVEEREALLALLSP